MRINLRGSTIFIVFGLFGGLCFLPFFVALFGGKPVEMLGYLLILLAIVFGGAFGRYFMLRIEKLTKPRAMTVGAGSALAAYFPFCVFLSVWMYAETPPGKHDSLIEIFAVTLVFGWFILGIVLVSFGAMAGYVCYRLSLSRSDTHE